MQPFGASVPDTSALRMLLPLGDHWGSSKPSPSDPEGMNIEPCTCVTLGIKGQVSHFTLIPKVENQHGYWGDEKQPDKWNPGISIMTELIHRSVV